MAGIKKPFVKKAHYQVDGSARCTADKAAERVAAHTERQTGVMVIMKRTEAFMLLDLESKSLSNPLYGEVAELLKFVLFHDYEL